jgi:hypothetical protein
LKKVIAANNDTMAKVAEEQNVPFGTEILDQTFGEAR